LGDVWRRRLEVGYRRFGTIVGQILQRNVVNQLPTANRAASQNSESLKFSHAVLSREYVTSLCGYLGQPKLMLNLKICDKSYKNKFVLT
jgi:hypothetical protein